MSECDEELPDLEPKVDTDTKMEISLRNDDDNTVDTSLDYEFEFEDPTVHYGNTTTTFRAVSDKEKDTASGPSTTTFRAMSAKKKDTASGPSTSGVTP